MRVRVGDKKIEDILDERFQELLDLEDSDIFTDEDADELDKLSEWYDAYMDYADAIRNIVDWYDAQGIKFRF